MATNIEITQNDNSDTEYNVYYTSDIRGEAIEVTGRLVPLDTGRGNEFAPDYIFEGDPSSDEEMIDEEIYQEIETEIVNYFYRNQDKIK
jgi:hypothetical protein